MWRLLLLMVALPAVAAPVEVPGDGVTLRAEHVAPTGPVRAGIVGLHGCGGPFPARDRQWRQVFAAAGHPSVWPDSFASRGLGSQCREPVRTVTPAGIRRRDALAAAAWLQAQPGTPPGGVVLVGWSNGGSTVLAAAKDPPPGLIRGIVAFYPGCRYWADLAAWTPAVPILIVMGADDDWTPAEPCRRLAARFPRQITLVEYPGAYHDFDVPDRPVRVRTGLAFTADGSGSAHEGTNPAGRQDALQRVPRFIAALPRYQP